jgi:hypothetical protein
LNPSKSSPSKGSQEHLKAQSLKNIQGLKINNKLQRACFFLEVAAVFFSKKAKPGGG